MAADRVAVGGGALHQFGRFLGVAADDEKGRAGALARERVQHLRGRRRRAVVESQNDFVILQVERAWIALQTESGSFRSDLDRSGDAERVQSAIAGERW